MPNKTYMPTTTAGIGTMLTAGHPEVTCTNGRFQGFNVWLTRPGAAQKSLGLSLGRHYEVAEPLPAPGAAEIWSFVVQMSQTIMVRG